MRRTSRCRRACSTQPPVDIQGGLPDQRRGTWPPHHARAVRRHHRQIGQPGARHPHSRHRPRRARLSGLRLHRLCGPISVRALVPDRHPERKRGAGRARDLGQDGGAEEDVSRRASTTSTSMTRRPSSSQSIHEVIKTIFIAIAPRGRRRLPVPADLASDDHPGGRHPGIARRHLLDPRRCSASRSTTCRCSAWCWPWASWSTMPSSWSRTSSATWRWACRLARPRTRRWTRCPTALIAIALTLCAVFVPAAFISGISGLFFTQFAITISASTIISVIVSLTSEPGALRGPAEAARRSHGAPMTLAGFLRCARLSHAIGAVPASLQRAVSSGCRRATAR